MKKNRSMFLRDLAERFRHEVTEGKLYLTPRLSLDDVSLRLGESRYDLSHAVNDCLGVGFCRFVNELRIAEAIRLLQAPDGDKWMVGRMARRIGYTDRKTFMRVCKEITGFSPSELKLRLTKKG